MSKNKRMPVWGMILTDTLLVCAAVGTFMLFDYVMPHSANTKGTVVAEVDSANKTSFALPKSEKNSDETEASAVSDYSADDNSSVSQDSSLPEKKKKEHHEHTKENWYDNTDTDEYTADKTLVDTVLNADVQSERVVTYEGDDAVIYIDKKWL